MHYVKIAWKHEHPQDPVLIYSELDDARWEVRKVEVFPDGSLGFAEEAGSRRGTGLGELAVG